MLWVPALHPPVCMVTHFLFNVVGSCPASSCIYVNTQLLWQKRIIKVNYNPLQKVISILKEKQFNFFDNGY